ncbi:hypothetical protein C0995_014316 [Termitomyces sp. Mi166|nr:hypothetical protein C0995_014316 [Termitomyces sp. Mi166\
MPDEGLYLEFPMYSRALDGTIVVYDKERDDGTFLPQDPIGKSPGPSVSEDGSKKEWDPTDSIFVTMPPWHPVTSGGGITSNGKSDREKVAKNPVSHWRTGGQDDLLTIFSPWEQRVVARCQGHSSFVSALAFDDLRCDGRTYRFGSVGEDNKLILWDFSSGALHRPKFHATHHQRMSMSSTISLGLRRDRPNQHIPMLTPPPLAGRSPRFHPAPSRNEVAVVQPVLIKNVEGDLLTSTLFLPRSILTATKSGHIKLWIRPLALKSRAKSRIAMVDVDALH